MPNSSKIFKEMIKAAKKGDLGKMKTLVASDANLIHAHDTDDSTPLHCAVWKGHQAVVAFLISVGADVNAQNRNDHWGTTPLHAAAHANQAAIAEMLIESGADLNAKDLNGKTPLHHTTFHQAKATAKVLQKHGAI